LHGKSKLKKGKKQGKWHGMMDFFKERWDKRCDDDGWCYDYETGAPIGPWFRENPACYHHILHKGIPQYAKYAFLARNIIIVSPNTHSLIHQDISKCPRTRRLTEELFQLHKNNEL
jgi:hypothetical protein